MSCNDERREPLEACRRGLLAWIRLRIGAAGDGDDAVPLRQASAAEPGEDRCSPRSMVRGYGPGGCTFGCGREWTDDARVMITRASNAPLAPRQALGSEQPASAPCYSGVFRPIARSPCRLHCVPGGVGEDLLRRCRLASDPVVDPDERGQAKPSESMPKLS